MRMLHRRTSANLVLALAMLLAAWQPWKLKAQGPASTKGVKFAQVSATELKEWLTYLASDQLQGRQVFSEGYGLAAAYVAERLKSWGVKPLGDKGTYFQIVKAKGYRVKISSSVTITAGGQSKTFKHGDHVTFGFNSGGKQTVTFNGAEFIGYGRPADLQKRAIKDKLVVWTPPRALIAGGRGGRGITPQPPWVGTPASGGGVGSEVIATYGAKAFIGLVRAPAPSPAEQA